MNPTTFLAFFIFVTYFLIGVLTASFLLNTSNKYNGIGAEVIIICWPVILFFFALKIIIAIYNYFVKFFDDICYLINMLWNKL